jgi:hypothetical protein
LQLGLGYSPHDCSYVSVAPLLFRYLIIILSLAVSELRGTNISVDAQEKTLDEPLRLGKIKGRRE